MGGSSAADWHATIHIPGHTSQPQDIAARRSAGTRLHRLVTEARGGTCV